MCVKDIAFNLLNKSAPTKRELTLKTLQFVESASKKTWHLTSSADSSLQVVVELGIKGELLLGSLSPHGFLRLLGGGGGNHGAVRQTRRCLQVGLKRLQFPRIYPQAGVVYIPPPPPSSALLQS